MGWKRTKGISAAQRDEETRRKPLLTRNSVVIIIYSFFEYRAQDSESGHWSGFGAEKKKKKDCVYCQRYLAIMNGNDNLVYGHALWLVHYRITEHY